MIVLLKTFVHVSPLDLLPLAVPAAVSANIGRRDGVPFAGVRFRGIVALALHGAQVNEDGAGHLLNLREQVNHQVKVVSVHRADILKAEFLKQKSRIDRTKQGASGCA